MAYWACAGFTLFSALVSAGFSLLALRMNTGHEYALYAASRSIALPLTTAFVLVRRSRDGVTALAIVMSLVQLFDAFIGFALHDPGRAYGPLAFSAFNAGLLWWMNRAAADKE
jgi:hypothetical protein